MVTKKSTTRCQKEDNIFPLCLDFKMYKLLTAKTKWNVMPRIWAFGGEYEIIKIYSARLELLRACKPDVGGRQ